MSKNFKDYCLEDLLFSLKLHQSININYKSFRDTQYETSEFDERGEFEITMHNTLYSDDFEHLIKFMEASNNIIGFCPKCQKELSLKMMSIDIDNKLKNIYIQEIPDYCLDYENDNIPNPKYEMIDRLNLLIEKFTFFHKELECTHCGHPQRYYFKLTFENNFTDDDKLLIEKIGEYPSSRIHIVPDEVPLNYKNNFLEAVRIMHLSPKSSAAMSRRLLQEILHEKFNINKNNLSKEIEEFIKKPNIPSYLSQSVDAIRNIGNFAAHPLKSTSTGEIVEVETGEVEWIIEILKLL